MMSITSIKNILWLLIALVAAFVFQIPMLLQGKYLFFWNNTLIIVTSITYLRNTLDFDQIFYHSNKWFRYGIFVFNILLFMFILNRLEILLGHIDSMAMHNLMLSDTISLQGSVDLFQYIHKEYLIFSVASFVGIVVYNIRILRSFWKRAKIKREKQLL